MPNTDQFITALWKESGALRGDESRLGLSISEIIEHSAQRNAKDEPRALKNWLQIYDEFLRWYVSLASILLAAVNNADQSAGPSQRAFCVLFGSIVSHLFSIRLLVTAGFDVAAKQVLRSLTEYAELAVLMSKNPALIAPFLEAQEPEEANRFWHQHLKTKKRGVRRRAILSAESIDAEAISDLLQWRKEEDAILSMSAHPSFLASFMSICVPGADENDGWVGFLGMKGEVSIRTLSYAVFSVSEIPLICPEIPFGTENTKKSGIVKYRDEDELHRHVKHGASVLVRLFMHILEEQDSANLRGERSTDHWFSNRSAA